MKRECDGCLQIFKQSPYRKEIMFSTKVKSRANDITPEYIFKGMCSRI
jgi:hypothetical protein